MEVVNCLSFTSERAPPKKSASAIPSIAFYGSANSNGGSRPNHAFCATPASASPRFQSFAPKMMRRIRSTSLKRCGSRVNVTSTVQSSGLSISNRSRVVVSSTKCSRKCPA